MNTFITRHLPKTNVGGHTMVRLMATAHANPLMKPVVASSGTSRLGTASDDDASDKPEK